MLETIPVRADEGFSGALVGQFLRTAGLTGFDPAQLEVEQFPAGHSNLTYLLRAGEWEAVLRRPPLGPVPPRAHDMAREFHILERLAAFPSAPEPFVLCEDDSVIGAPFYVMERRRAWFLDQESPARGRRSWLLHRDIAESLVKVLVDLHAVDWRAAGLGEIGRPDGFLQRQVSGWIERYGRARTDDVAEFEVLAAWLLAELPESPPATVVHNDYKLDNVVLDPSSLDRVVAVLDWEMATVGDPLSDVASLLVYWTQPDEIELMGGLKSVTAEPGFPSRPEIKRFTPGSAGATCPAWTITSPSPTSSSA